jgi:hypothetical protein
MIRLRAELVTVHTRHPFVIARGGSSEYRTLRVILTDADGYTSRDLRTWYPTLERSVTHRSAARLRVSQQRARSRSSLPGRPIRLLVAG